MPLQNLDAGAGQDRVKPEMVDKVNAAIDRVNDIDAGLPGGTTGQALKKASNSDYDYDWESITETDVTKGTTAVSNGLSLARTISSGSPYTIINIVYRYDYTLYKKMCNLSFSVTFDVTDGAGITEFQIPMPAGIDKDTTYRFFGSGFYIVTAGSPTTTRCPLELRTYKDGTEGQRLVLRRSEDAIIVSDTGISVLIEGCVSFITT